MHAIAIGPELHRIKVFEAFRTFRSRDRGALNESCARSLGCEHQPLHRGATKKSEGEGMMRRPWRSRASSCGGPGRTALSGSMRICRPPHRSTRSRQGKIETEKSACETRQARKNLSVRPPRITQNKSGRAKNSAREGGGRRCKAPQKAKCRRWMDLPCKSSGRRARNHKRRISRTESGLPANRSPRTKRASPLGHRQHSTGESATQPACRRARATSGGSSRVFGTWAGYIGAAAPEFQIGKRPPAQVRSRFLFMLVAKGRRSRWTTTNVF